MPTSMFTEFIMLPHVTHCQVIIVVIYDIVFEQEYLQEMGCSIDAQCSLDCWRLNIASSSRYLFLIKYVCLRWKHLRTLFQFLYYKQAFQLFCSHQSNLQPLNRCVEHLPKPCSTETTHISSLTTLQSIILIYKIKKMISH